MKIVRIIARLNIGGPARNAVLLAEGLNDVTPHPSPLPKGEREVYWETVLVCGEVGEGEGDMMYLAREKGIEPVVVPELGRELSFWDDWQAFWKIYRIICKERPDILHTHTAKAGALGRLAGVLYNASLTFSPHPNPLPSWGEGKRGRCVLVHTFHGHVLRGYFGKVKTLFFIWVEKFLALFTDRIITVSEALKKELVEKFKVAPEGKFSVVELGFELDELLKLPMKKASNVINIGIVGRLVPVKNHKMLFRVLKMVKGEGRRVKLIVIGDGELRQELEDYVKALKIEDVVEFRGWVKNLQKVYEELDILTLTSLNEGTPVSIIEAMAAARSVVATDVGGVRDVVLDGESGYLIASGDGEGFANRLADLVKDREKRVRFGERGREIVRDRFSKDRLIRDMERVYGEIASPPAADRNDRGVIF